MLYSNNDNGLLWLKAAFLVTFMGKLRIQIQNKSKSLDGKESFIRDSCLENV